MDTAVVWFRDDLRVDDNPTLVDAVAAADRVVPVYVADPRRQGPTQYETDKRGRFGLDFVVKVCWISGNRCASEAANCWFGPAGSKT